MEHKSMTAGKNLIHEIWSDEAFAQELLADPKSALKPHGFVTDDDVEIKVVRDSEKLRHVCIPAAPSEGEIGEEDLLRAQGGTTPVCASFVASFIVSAVGTITIVETL
ncbi:hypothetical protein Q5Y75_06560 [Ruegeria sp. 2205SS24-7]|uniref:hypothetical protein n=1 Tax=Ruegeria discodermiae TaxID=3064389 RepID=UPI00274169B0|nr:hypothetical protein [Ruegeria sp. 2205SS24-7]MDP5216874.1 hypothetical protein [Ruegeria sp. 2205SS24-7]